MTASTIDLSIVVPCFNEQDALPPLAERVAGIRNALGWTLELVLIDDGSQDNTWQVIQDLSETYCFIKPVRHPTNLGIVAGWQTGHEAAGGTYLVTMDADLQYRPEDIIDLKNKLLSTGADVAQGARVREPERTALRRFLTAGLSWLLNLMFGMNLKDNKSGFILCKREVFGDTLTTRFTYRQFQHFIAVAIHAKGYRIVQIPVTFDPRVAGVSFMARPIRFALSAVADLPYALWEFRIARRRVTH
jgi:glycosyltransferase involved in cell wall biosynthesis